VGVPKPPSFPLIERKDMKIEELFVDSLGQVSVQANLVRIELMQLQKLPAEKESPVFQVAERLAMNLDTFLRLHQAMNNIVGQMEEKGLIKKNEAPALTNKKK
jgi:hypothetical protein